jgi:hypothetical protein
MPLRLALTALLLGVMNVGACTSASSNTDAASGDLGMVPGDKCCTPGEASSCKCLDGKVAQQTCIEQGVGYNACPCQGLGPVPTTPQDEFSSANPCGDCDGCCDGTGCVKLGNQSKGACGSRTTCLQCESMTECEPDVGICTVSIQPDCNASSCADGCCLDNRCIPQVGLACGIAGGSCTACSRGTLCDSSGVCSGAVDASSYVKLSLKSITLVDSACSVNKPKLQVCAHYEQTSPYVQKLQGCAPICAAGSSCSPTIGTLSSGDSPVLFPGRALANGYEIQVWDNAATPPRLIARDKVAGVMNLMGYGEIGAFGQVASLTLAVE